MRGWQAARMHTIARRAVSRLKVIASSPLSAAGIPVIADRGRAGGFRLADGFHTQLTGLTESEAETLFLAGLPGPLTELGLADPMAMARAKPMAALPAGARAERVAARFHLDAAGWFRTTEPVAVLPMIARAVWDARYLRFRYGEGDDSGPRKVGPLGLVLKGSIWYLVAQKGNAFRTYRVGRMSGVEALPETYPRPAKFDLPAWWARSSREYEMSTYRESAEIRLSSRGRALVGMLGPYVVEAVAKTAAGPDAHGWIRCTIPLESGDLGIRELLRLGADVEVVSPESVRASVARALRETLRRYAPPPSPRRG